MENILNGVMTFTEACQYIGKSPSYFNNLVETGKIIEDVHYRKAGGSKLILKSVVDDIKNNTYFMSMNSINYLTENVGTLYCVCIPDVCDSAQGYFTDKEKAVKYAKKISKNVEIYMLIWNDENEEYEYADTVDMF